MVVYNNLSIANKEEGNLATKLDDSTKKRENRLNY